MPLMLVDVEHRVQLPPARRPSIRVPVDRDGEATFSVNETDDPERIELERDPDGFLLIVRTVGFSLLMPRPYDGPMTRTSTARYSDVPAYSQVLQRPVGNSPL